MTTWYYTSDGKSRLGPFSLEQMQTFARSGELKPAHMARHEGSPKWTPAGTFQELFSTPPPLLAMPVAPQTGASSPQPSAAGVALKDPASLFDFDENDAEPVAAPTPRRRREEPSFGAKAWAAVGPAVLAVWSVPLATGREARRRVSLFRLRRQQRRQQREQEQFIVESGIRLLSAGVSVPGCEDFSKRYQQLSHSHQLANQQAVAGNKEKRKEAARLESDLRLLYADFGQKALASGVAFAGRERDETRKQQIESGLAQTREQIDARVREWAAAPPQAKWRVGIGSAAAALLVVGFVWLMWPSGDDSHQTAAATGVAKETPVNPAPQPPPPVKLALGDLIEVLTPAVPLVEAVDAGSGSGFLVNHKGKYLVVTNRHVVENATRGLTVHFPLKETRLTVPSNDAKVVAIHRAADLALIDVSGWKAQIDRLKIKPVKLAQPEQYPRRGDTVFALGHPGAGQGATVLTSSYSKGDVSAVGREMDGARFLQTTTAINPGNSGGPLFDMDGRVVGVNTFIIRGRAGSGVTLEGLNFALEVAFVDDLLKNPGSSLDAKAVAAVVNPPPVEATAAMTRALRAKLGQFGRQGYKPLEEGKSSWVFRLKPGEHRLLPLVFDKGQYAIAVVSEGVEDLDLGVLGVTPPGWVAQCKDTRPDPEVKFQAKKQGPYIVFVRNSMAVAATVSVTRLKK